MSGFLADLTYIIALLGNDTLLPMLALVTLFTVVLAVRDGMS